MSRDDGFAIADIDAGLFADPKIVALARQLRDPVQTAAHVALYQALVLGSWGAGERITLNDALPAWWLEPVDDIQAKLVAVGLLDGDGRIPEHSWDAWFTPAWERREARRESGRIGGRKSRPKASPKHRSSDATATLNPTGRQAGPSDPPAPSVSLPPTPSPDGEGASKRDEDDHAPAPPAASGRRRRDPVLWWPRGGAPMPSTVEEAEANIRTLKQLFIRTGSPDRSRAEERLRTLARSNGSRP